MSIKPVAWMKNAKQGKHTSLIFTGFETEGFEPLFPAIPDTHRVVPVEPTDKMVDAAPWNDGTGEVVAVYAIPDTHQIMPVRLTDKMIEAALPELMREDDEDKYRALGQLICVWDALVEAAKEEGK